MRLCIGQAALTGKLSRYAQNFNLLELRADLGAIARPPRLREYRAAAPPGFVFSVLSARELADLTPGEATDKALSYAEKAVAALDAEWFVLQTGSGLAPSARGRARLEAALERASTWGKRLAWEPRGPWATEQAREFCAERGLTLVGDCALEDPTPGSVLYSRVRAIGAAGRITSGAGDRIVDRISGFEEAFIVVESASAKSLARSLRQELDVDSLGQDEPAFDEEEE